MKNLSLLFLPSLLLPLVACDTVRGAEPKVPTPVPSVRPLPEVPTPPPVENKLILNRYRFDEVIETGTRASEGASAIARSPIDAETRTLCQALWAKQNTANFLSGMSEAENPYRLLRPEHDDWVFETQLKGSTVEVLPSQFRGFDLTYSERWPDGEWVSNQRIHCDFPESWQGLVQQIQIAFPAVLKQYSACYGADLLNSGLCDDGYDARGGLVLRRTEYTSQFLMFDHQFYLGWTLVAPHWTEQDAKSVLKAIKFPTSIKIALQSVLTQVGEDSTHPVRAIQFAATEGFSDVSDWQVVSESPDAEGRRHRFLKVETSDDFRDLGFSPSKDGIRAALADADVLPLSFGRLWDSAARRDVRSRNNVPINQLLDFELYQLTLKTWGQGKSLSIRFVWRTDDPRWFETRTAIRPDGVLEESRTRSLVHPAELGLPNNLGVK